VRKPIVYSIPMRTRFRGITVREGVLLRGDAGWGEFSPFLDYGGAEIVPWLRAAREAADVGFPPPLRREIWVNVTIPAVDALTAHRMAAASGCRTAKVKVAEPGQTLSDDLDRVEAVRDALGPRGRIRVDANGGWSVEGAVDALAMLARFGLEYAEQPCRTVEELAQLRRQLVRRRIDVPIAADESIRRSGDPERVAALAAADIAVLKVQPLGGVRACLRLAEVLGLPVVVSSALETSIGIRMGLALAAALPRLDYDCGLNTVALLTNDVVTEPLIANGGRIGLRDVAPDADRLAACAAGRDRERAWQDRLTEAAGPVERAIAPREGGAA